MRGIPSADADLRSHPTARAVPCVEDVGEYPIYLLALSPGAKMLTPFCYPARKEPNCAHYFKAKKLSTEGLVHFGGSTAIASTSNNAPGRASCGTPIVVLAGGAAVFTYSSRTSR